MTENDIIDGEDFAPVVDKVDEIQRLFPGKTNTGKLRAEWVWGLLSESDQELEHKCRDYVYLSWRNASDSRSDYHWRAEALRYVCEQKGLDFYDIAKRQIFGY